MLTCQKASTADAIMVIWLQCLRHGGEGVFSEPFLDAGITPWNYSHLLNRRAVYIDGLIFLSHW